MQLSVAEALADAFAQARKAGLDGMDWAVAQYCMAQQRGTLVK